MVMQRNRKAVLFGQLAVAFVVGVGLATAVFLIGLPLLDNSAPSSSEESVASDSRIAGEARLQTLSEISELPGPSERTALHQLLADIDDERLLDLLNQSSQVREEFRTAMQVVILQRMARIYPLNALKWLGTTELKEPALLTKAIFAEWAQTDLDSAVSYAASSGRSGETHCPGSSARRKTRSSRRGSEPDSRATERRIAHGRSDG